jgi:hypothetical protein
MNAVAEQMSLFTSPQVGRVAVAPEPECAQVTFAEMAYAWLQKRKEARGERVCRHCHRSESDLGNLSDGEPCVIDEVTGYCSAPHCLAAAARTFKGKLDIGGRRAASL